jgi:hypothetical protein
MVVVRRVVSRRRSLAHRPISSTAFPTPTARKLQKSFIHSAAQVRISPCASTSAIFFPSSALGPSHHKVMLSHGYWLGCIAGVSTVAGCPLW